MKTALFSAAIAVLFASSAISQVTIPPHSSVYNGYSRGFNFTSNTNFIISQLDLPPEAYQAGDTAGYLVRVNGAVALHSVGNAGAISTTILVNSGDVVDIIGNWSPAAPGSFTAHNSYGSTAPYNTMIEGVAHVLNRTGWQWDIGDPAYGGSYLAPGSGSIGRVFMYTTPQSGLFPNFSSDVQIGASPLTVNFTDATFTSDPGGITAWAWDVDNNGTDDYFTQNCTHIYNTGGTYSVKLTVTDTQHGSQSLTKTNYIVVDPMTAGFTATPTFGTAPLIVNFTDTSFFNPIAWSWDFDNDGIPDSNLQNPVWLYPAGGRFSVALTVSNGVNQDTVVLTDLITVVAPTNNTRGAEILEFQFNEPRGSTVANVASTTLAPSQATVGPNGVPNSAWQGDPGRSLFQGNEAGYGCLAADNVSPYEARVNTGWPVDIVGSHTIMFWANVLTATNYPYAFGTTSGSARCYHDGTHWSLRSWGNLGTPYPLSGSNPMTLAGWNHWTIVIDDATGTAQWYLNGVADGTPRSFTPNSFVMQNTFGTLTIGGYSTSSTFGRYADMDDFRLYGRALTVAEIAAAMAAENPAASTFGDGCTGPVATPTIGASGGAPAIGNAAFQVNFDNLESGMPSIAQIGLWPVSGGLLPFDLGAYLGATHTGCPAEILPDFTGVPFANTGSGAVALPIPNFAGLAGWHIYVQGIVLGTTGAVSPALDVNLQL